MIVSKMQRKKKNNYLFRYFIFVIFVKGKKYKKSMKSCSIYYTNHTGECAFNSTVNDSKLFPYEKDLTVELTTTWKFALYKDSKFSFNYKYLQCSITSK